MDFQQIVQIHQKEKELKEELQKIIEKKRNEFNLLNNYRNQKEEELKVRLNQFKIDEEKNIKEYIDSQISNITNETKNLLKNFDEIDRQYIQKAIEYIKDEFFKD